MPDLNSVPPSPHVLAATRRTSSQQLHQQVSGSGSQQQQQQQTAVMMPPPPPVPSSPSLDILPSNQAAVNNPTATAVASAHASIPPPLPSPLLGSGEVIVNAGPGPLRHPQPLTAADLHMQMEKEQEARINRLSRELSHLRAQHNASVASNASSASASASASGAEQAVDTNHLMSGTAFVHPSTRRHHHRSSSNTSTRSQTTASAAAALLLGTSVDSSHGGSLAAAARTGGLALSRQGSNASHRSRGGSPSPAHLALGADSTYGYFQAQRIPAGPTSAPPPGSSTTSLLVGTPGSVGFGGLAPPSEGYVASPALLPATPRYEETAFYRSELESAKADNETLRRRVRDLERQLRDVRTTHSVSGSRTRSDSTVSTAASAAGSTNSSTGAIAGGTPSVSASGIAVAGPREGGRAG